MARPFLFKTQEALEARIKDYWHYCELHEKPLTICGLAYYLGMTRQTLYNYSKRDKFGDVICDARARIEMDMDERLQVAGNATTGIIFSLKNNFQWDADNKLKADVNNTNKNYDFSNLTTNEIKELLKNE